MNDPFAQEPSKFVWNNQPYYYDDCRIINSNYGFIPFQSVDSQLTEEIERKLTDEMKADSERMGELMTKQDAKKAIKAKRDEAALRIALAFNNAMTCPESETTTPFKDKKDKLRFDLIPPEFDKAFAEVSTMGIEKLRRAGVDSPERNWEQGLKLVADHLAAVKRHINKWELGENLNVEKGFEGQELHHLKHALWHLGAMVTQIERGRNDLDDRPPTAEHSNKEDNI